MKERGKPQVEVTGFYCTKTQKKGENQFCCTKHNDPQSRWIGCARTIMATLTSSLILARAACLSSSSAFSLASSASRR